MDTPRAPVYVEVAVNVPQARGVFHYHLPDTWQTAPLPGQLVTAPFGRQQVQGIILRQVTQPEVAQTRPLLDLLDEQPVLTAAQLQLAQHLAETCLAPLASCLSMMLPPGLSQQAEAIYSLKPTTPGHNPGELSDLQQRLLAVLRARGALRTRQLGRAFAHVDWQAAMHSLVRRGLVQTQAHLTAPAVTVRTVRVARLAVNLEQARAALPSLSKPGSPALARRQAMLRKVMEEPNGVEIAWLYAHSRGNKGDIDRLVEQGLIVLGDKESVRDPLSGVSITTAAPPQLTPAQQTAWEALAQGVRQAAADSPPRPVLLHGVTGSGKTELYLRAVAETLRLGRQAIVLVPEIALTPQTVQRFLGRFPGQVGLVHSQLSAGERYDTWRRARDGSLGVIVGPRSALFAPLARIGLIVMDEFHDESYYQSEPAPAYHTRQAVLALAKTSGALAVFGSATPEISGYYEAEQGRWQLLELPQRVPAFLETVQDAAPAPDYTPALPEVRVVDMREELKDGNRSIFSQALQQALGQVLERQQQAILFLNRRGAATYVFCRDCGHTLKCPRCEIPLTQHLRTDPTGKPVEGSRLICHRCGYQRGLPKTCPECRGSRIRQYGMGTEKVESEVAALFPQARLLRWDADTTRQKGAHAAILAHFARHQADILVGTQMLAKGLDLPLVTLVGVVLADVGLSLPDYRAGERGFQLLTQVAGRAGRSPLGGQVILQTFQPEHYAIQAAAQHDFKSFYRQELAHRRRLGYPPAAHLVRLEVRARQESSAEQQARKMASRLAEWGKRTGRSPEMIGPAPCFFSKVNGMYRWQVVLRGPNPLELLRQNELDSTWRVEVDPPSLL